MPRLSIDISAQEHQELKAIAALKGQSIKDYILMLTQADISGARQLSHAEALNALKGLLAVRREEARVGKLRVLTSKEIGKIARSRLSQ